MEFNFSLEDIDEVILDAPDDEVQAIKDEVIEDTDINNNNINDGINNLERTMIIVESLHELAINIGTRDRLSTEDIELLKIASKLAVAGTDTPSDKLLPSLESYSNINIATEGIGDVIRGACITVLKSIENYIKNIVDNQQRSWILWQLQDQKLKELRKRLSYVNTKSSVLITVRANKNMKYDERGLLVKDTKDYTNKFKEATIFGSDLLDNVGEFTEKDFFSSWKTLLSPITGYDANFKKMFISVDKLIKTGLKLPTMKQVDRTNKRIEYSSEVI